jgi:hypothetical protein
MIVFTSIDITEIKCHYKKEINFKLNKENFFLKLFPLKICNETQNQRLYQLQQKYQPSIPRHMHFLRLAVLREFSLPDGLLPVIRDPCQYYPLSKSIKQQYGIVQGYRYYRKLRELESNPPSSSRPPDVAIFPSNPCIIAPQGERSTIRTALTLNKVHKILRKIDSFREECFLNLSIIQSPIHSCYKFRHQKFVPIRAYPCTFSKVFF